MHMNILYNGHTAFAHVIDRAHGPLVRLVMNYIFNAYNVSLKKIKHALDLLFKMKLI